MTTKIIVPELGESVLDATISQWLKREGESVSVGDVLVELETDKVNLEVGAEKSGVLARIEKGEGEDVKVGDEIGLIEEGEVPEGALPPKGREEAPAGKAEPQPSNGSSASQAAPVVPRAAEVEIVEERVTPVARKVAQEYGVDLKQVQAEGTRGRITKSDVEKYVEHKAQPAPAPASAPEVAPLPSALPARQEERVKMSRRRRTIAQRLVEGQHAAAMLTTFNEVDMTAIMDLRQRRNESFLARYGVKLGIASFFVKAALGALKGFPRLNAEVQGEEMILKHYYDIGIAVGAPEGLVVPVLRDAERLSFAEIEKKIKEFAQKAEEGTLTLEDLRGGTFTITNGGVFGSLLSTPILNPPQVGILGLHKIERRPVAIGEQVAIRSMMYVALSYDHRIVDGQEAVRFLVRVKELIEDPEALLLES